MQWSNFPWGPALTFAVLFCTIASMAMDERNRRKFATREEVIGSDGKAKFPTREEMNGMGERIDKELRTLLHDCERNGAMFVKMDDRVGYLEGQAERMAERQTQQWERISEQMASTARTIDNVSKKQEDIAKMLHEFALELERTHRNDRNGL